MAADESTVRRREDGPACEHPGLIRGCSACEEYLMDSGRGCHARQIADRRRSALASLAATARAMRRHADAHPEGPPASSAST